MIAIRVSSMEWTDINLSQCPICNISWDPISLRCPNWESCKMLFLDTVRCTSILKTISDNDGWFYSVEWNITFKKCYVLDANPKRGIPEQGLNGKIKFLREPLTSFDIVLPFNLTLEKIKTYLLLS